MTEFKTNINGLTIGKLKEIIRDIPNDSEINVWNVGETGFIDSSELEIITYENLEMEVNINVKAESGYH